MTKAQPEQRTSKRVRSQGPVNIKVLDGLTLDEAAQLRDVSMRGVFMYLQRKVSLGSTLELVLPLPEGVTAGEERWIRCTCRVVRVEETGRDFGVAAMIEEFEPLDQAQVPRA